MNICGIELKSNYAVLVVVNEEALINSKKIMLEEDESQEDIRKFCNEFLLFLEQNYIEKIVIKTRAKKGNFAGGAITFKLEALIQLNPLCKVEFITAKYISTFEKKNSIVYPKNLKKYQEQAYLSACCSLLI